MSVYGITNFGAYIPRLRMERATIAAAHRWMAPSLKSGAKGHRAFCSWDEDSITMAVEAARDALRDGAPDPIRSLRLASTTHPYADLSNGVIVASAIGLRREVSVANSSGSQRAGTTAMMEAFRDHRGASLLIASDKPVSTPASSAEMATGAGAAAFTFGDQDVVAVLLASATRSVNFVDRFRSADASSDYVWEERWIRDEGYSKIVPEAVKAALDQAGVAPSEVQHLILPSPIRGIAAGIANQIGFTGEIGGAFEPEVGYCGVAHGMLALAEVLAIAKPHERILLLGFGQGVDVLLLETTEACGRSSGRRGVAGAVSDGLVTQDYLRLLSFYDQLALDWGMRGEKTGKAALTEQYRESAQLDTFTGGTCQRCGSTQFPILAYCAKPGCGARSEEFASAPLADEPARVLTITSDWLSYHPAPPLAVGFIQFDVGARVLMELVDARPDQIVEGTPVRMVYRIKERDKIRGFNRYFWKATPVEA